MIFKNEKCPKCGKYNIMLPSNNPLVPSVCNYCVTTSLDYNNLEHGDFFCRTYNLPFIPDKWLLLSKAHKQNVFKEYIDFISNERKDTLYYNSPTGDLWKKANEEWQIVQTHEELIMKMEPLREGYLLRNRIKWGINYTFEELIRLENLFVNTVKANDITNPMQIDAIKKACKMSISLDRAITNAETKEINDLSKAYQNFVKTAKIDDIITAASQDVISNVSELVDFIEKSGFKFNYYDNVARDVVDVSINDMKEFIRRLVADATGLETTFENINSALKRENEMKAAAGSYEKVSLEDLYQNALSEQNKEFDNELQTETFEEMLEEDLEDIGDDNDRLQYF